MRPSSLGSRDTEDLFYRGQAGPYLAKAVFVERFHTGLAGIRLELGIRSGREDEVSLPIVD
jgi:hypothetical protein